MVTGGVKRQGQWGYRAYKNTDKIGSAMMTFTERPLTYVLKEYVPVYVNHAKVSMCRGACMSASVLAVWVCPHAYST